MYRITIALLFTLFAFNTSNASSKTDSKIKEVTVYNQYARITRTANASVSAGNSEIILQNLPTNIIASSIQTKVKGGATLLSLNYQINYLQDQESSELVKQLQDSLYLLANDIKWIQNQRASYQGEEKLINLNNKLGSTEKGMTVQELKELSTFYLKRTLEIRKKLLGLEKEEYQLNLSRNRIQGQLNQLNASAQKKPTGEIVLQLAANVSSKVSISFTYLTTGAGWTPSYDLRYVGIEKPINLVYKANVYQNSGYDWKDVKLTISNGNPAQNNDRPILNPLYVNFYTAPVAIRGGRSKANMAYVDGMQMQPQLMEEEVSYDDMELDKAPEYKVSVNESQITAEYTIELKQDIPSDGKYHLVNISDVNLDAKYQYHSVPRLDKGAFLLAKVYDYGKHHLQPGTANIFFEDMYIGQSQLNPFVSSDTMLVSLGRDNGISVERTQLNDLTSTKFIGSNKKQTYGYEITIKNNKTRSIDLEILDAFPISQNSEIEVELLESGDAEVNSDYGKLSWDLIIPTGQSKKLNFSYSIKYPKDRVIMER